MYFIEGTHTELNMPLKKHLESITVKRELDDFDDRKNANEVDRDLDQQSTIKTEKEMLETQTELSLPLKKHPFTFENITVKSQLDDFDNRSTANEVDPDWDQKSTIKSDEENLINSPYLVSHEEIDIKSEDGVEQSNDRFSKDQMKLHKCPYCPYQSNRKSRIKEHSVRHRNPGEIAWHRCTECPYKTAWKANLKLHAVVHDKTRQFLKILKCEHCVYETPRKKNFKRHLKMHRKMPAANIPQVHCPEPKCRYKTYDMTLLKRHSWVHNDQLFKCTQCPYQAKRQDYLKSHQLKHDSTKWHACPQCPFKTIRKSNLNLHVVQMHTNPDELKWYICEQCPFKTTRKYSLSRHAFTHNVDQTKGLQCTFCSFQTLQKYHLRLHQVEHQDDNGFCWHECPECPYKAKYKSHLLRHAKNHQATDRTDWLQCPECSYRTLRRNHLRAHQMLHANGSTVSIAHAKEIASAPECSV